MPVPHTTAHHPDKRPPAPGPTLAPPRVEDASWRGIEAGVQQRMRVLEALLADIYGPQHLVAGNLLPPALVHGHPGYLRGMRGVTPAGGCFLHLAAFDIAHDAQGQSWVVAQRLQAPPGLADLADAPAHIAHLVPGPSTVMRMQPLATPFEALAQSLRAQAPAGGQTPRVVLLASGPWATTGGEAERLARHTDLPLVQGADLSVRGERVYQRTTQGLEPVHAILRWLDDEVLDPLELRADALAGVPGLMQAVRAGQVLVANAPGVAPLESPALFGFLPAISKHLLGETLQLPSLATWWCGERAALEAALPDLARRVIRPTHGAPGTQLAAGRALSPAGLGEWARHIQDEPDAFTLQDEPPLLPVPAADAAHASHPEPATRLLRVFALRDVQGGWQVLPADLAE